MKQVLDVIPKVAGSRTLGWNSIFAALYTAMMPVLLAFDWTQWVEPRVAGVILAILTIIQTAVNGALRYDTTGPVPGNAEQD